MPEITTPNPLHELNPIDDAGAARMAEPQTHADLMESILASDPAAHQGHTRRIRRPVLIAGLAAAFATALVLIVPNLGSDRGSPGPSPANAAAVVKGAIESLATKPGTIVTIQEQEQFAGISGVMAGKRIEIRLKEIWWLGRHGGEQAQLMEFSASHGLVQVGKSSISEFFDPATDTVYKTHRQTGMFGGSAGNPIISREETAAQLESMWQHGKLRLTGEKTIDGQRALVLVCAPNCQNIAGGRVEYDVAQGTYDLLRKSSSSPGQSTTDTIQEFKTEPATPATERQFELTNTHPDAKVVWLSANAYATRMVGASSGR